MSTKNIQLFFFTALTLGLLVVLFFVFKPYIGVLFVSGVFSIVFYPIFERLKIKFKERKNLAAFVTTFLIFIFIIIPVALISTALIKEAADLYNSMAFGGSSQEIIIKVNTAIQKLNSFFPSDVIGSEVDLEAYVRDILNWVMGHFGSVFGVVFGGAFNFALALISLYYLFINGSTIKKWLISWSPLPDEYDENFINTLKSAINAVLKGRFLVSIAQGILIGIGFAIFGIESPILWGVVGAIASLIPILGTSIVTIPAVAYLFLSDHLVAGVGLLVWSIIIVGFVDNFLSVFLLKDRIKMHPLIILLSILGGVEVFGFMGFLIGPIIVSAFIALMKIYPFIILHKSG